MARNKKPNGYWTKERCKKEAKKYETRNAFRKSPTSAYSIAWKNGWLDEICAHMKRVGNRYLRAIYAIEFPNRSVYVGLTQDYQQRFDAHITHSHNKNVREMMEENGGFYWREFGVWMTKTEASIKEGLILEEYIDDGYKILNINVTGGLGGGEKFWTKDRVLKAARKCNTRSEFIEKHSAAYQIAKDEGFYEECIKHMQSGKNSNGHWIKERVLVVARKCQTREEFRTRFNAAHSAAHKKGWWKEATAHMGKKRTNSTKPPKWTDELVFEKAKECRSISEFHKKHSGGFKYAIRHNLKEQLDFRG